MPSLFTKHGKYYELNPYRVIERLEDIQDKVFELYKNMDRFYSDIPVKSNFTEIEYEIIDVIEDIRYAQEHYLTIGSKSWLD